MGCGVVYLQVTGRLQGLRSGGFPAEDCPLAGRAPMITADPSISPDHPVTGDEKGNRIAAHSSTDRSKSLWRAYTLRNSPIGGGNAQWYFQQAFPDLQLKRCAFEVQFDFWDR